MESALKIPKSNECFAFRNLFFFSLEIIGIFTSILFLGKKATNLDDSSIYGMLYVCLQKKKLDNDPLLQDSIQLLEQNASGV